MAAEFQPRLPDPRRSSAVLIGASTYTSHSDDLVDLPSVRNNVTSLARVLAHPLGGGLQASRCVTLVDPVGVRGVHATLRKYAAQATDTFLLYYAGHGLQGPNGALYLAMSDTDIEDAVVSALSVPLIHSVFEKSPARNLVLIVDSCYSGRLLRGMSASGRAVADQLAIEGAFALSAAPDNRESLAPAGATYTLFTGELLRLLMGGVAGGPELLTCEVLYKQLIQAIKDPAPQRRNRGMTNELALCRNAAYPLSQTSAPTGLPEAPPLAEDPLLGSVHGPSPLAPDRTLTMRPTGILLSTLQAHGTWARAVAWSGDGQRLVSGGMDARVRLWDPKSGIQQAAYEGHQRVAGSGGGYPPDVMAVDWSPDGRHVASGGSDGATIIWDTASGRARHVCRVQSPVAGLKRFGAFLTNAYPGLQQLTVAFSPDGQRLASGGQQGGLRIWDVRSGNLLRTMHATDDVQGVSWSPDGRQIATCGKSITVWDVLNGAHRGTMRGNGRLTGSVAWAPDGQSLASVGHDRTVRIWDVHTGECRLRLDGHREPGTAVTWSPDSQHLASAGGDDSICVWDAGTGSLLLRLFGHIGQVWNSTRCAVQSVAWSPRGTELASAGADGTVRLWEIFPY